jgi:uncharacterized glyoxalase superfamily protein PhnB
MSSLVAALIYKDNRAALDWLERVFGFERRMVLVDSDDAIVHAEMSHGDSFFMVGMEWTSWTKSPAALGGVNTQFMHARLQSDIDGHCARARAAGAQIIEEPSDQFYGDRRYRALDLDGHVWTFAQTVREVSTEDMEKASGLTLKTLPK